MANTRNTIRKNAHKEQQPPCKILLIEDQKSLANMAAQMLQEQLNCDVTIAYSYAETRQILKDSSEPFFMAVCDLNLPDAMNGEVIDMLIKQKQPVVAVTGYFDQAMHATLIEKGVIDYVLKKNINAYEYLSQLIRRLYFNQFIKVLVIDDSTSIQKVTGSYLRKQYLNLVYAKNGEEGLAKLEQYPEIQLALVDAEMPIMNGLTFTAMARKQRTQKDLCIIGISSTGQKDLSAQFLKHGANDFISKPFSYDELTCRVNQNLNIMSYIQKVEQLANVDFLTGLPNRRNFFSEGQKKLLKATQKQKPTVVGILDVDFFKNINDTHGHDCGDITLQHITHTIKSVFNEHTFGRIGGEEFGFILSADDPDHLASLVNQLLIDIRHQKILHLDKELNVTVSIGVTNQLKATLDETLKHADDCLYQAKSTGRNKIVWHDDTDAIAV